ncbi:MAG: hypothetical protein KME64_28225 [Scytonematopsis contorta HA4267-MV1]|nr:hypothetical protein [Scytonematopsis contorta HA4267-MV1]
MKKTIKFLLELLPKKEYLAQYEITKEQIAAALAYAAELVANTEVIPLGA